jgi:cysteinyl-tRNA synthetase
MMSFDKVLGVLGDSWRREGVKLSEEVEELIRKREEARRLGDWGTADTLREELRKMGIILEDTPEGVKWRKER